MLRCKVFIFFSIKMMFGEVGAKKTTPVFFLVMHRCIGSSSGLQLLTFDLPPPHFQAGGHPASSSLTVLGLSILIIEAQRQKDGLHLNTIFLATSNSTNRGVPNIHAIWLISV